MNNDNSFLGDEPDMPALRAEVSRLTMLLQEAESKANGADGLRLEAERRLEAALVWLKEAEAQVANQEVRLQIASEQHERLLRDAEERYAERHEQLRRDSQEHCAALERRLAWTEALLTAECDRVDQLSKLASASRSPAALEHASEQAAEAAAVEDGRRVEELTSWLRAAEAEAANAEARLRDAERVAADRQTEILALQAALRLHSANGKAASDIASVPNTALESLLNEYGLFDLSALVKTRRCADEAGSRSSTDAEGTG